jgi:hypothetical protein
MKVLFVGEGRHDIGPAVFGPHPRPAAGVVSALCRRINPRIATDSVSLRWQDIATLNRSKRGLEHKLVAAKELAVRHGCTGTIAVVDRDGPNGAARIDDLQNGRSRSHANDSAVHPIAVGMAVESIEAWTLGDPQAIANVLGVSVDQVRQIYRESKVEEFHEQSGKSEFRPKEILKQVTDLKHRLPDVAFRVDVANQTDLAILESNCPNGFAPFAEDVRRIFSTT